MKKSIFELDFRYPNFIVKKNKIDKIMSSDISCNSYRVKELYNPEYHSKYIEFLNNPQKTFGNLEINHINYRDSLRELNKLVDVFELKGGEVLPTLGYLRSIEFFILNQYPQLLEFENQSKELFEVFDSPHEIAISDLILKMYNNIDDRFPNIKDFCELPEIKRYNLDPKKFNAFSNENFNIIQNSEYSLEYQALLHFLKIKRVFDDSFLRLGYIEFDNCYLRVISKSQKIYEEFKHWVDSLENNKTAKIVFKKNDFRITHFNDESTGHQEMTRIYKDFINPLHFNGFDNEIKASNLPLILKKTLGDYVQEYRMDFSIDKMNLAFSKDFRPYTIEFLNDMKAKGVVVQKNENNSFSLLFDTQGILKKDISLNDISDLDIDKIFFNK